METGTQINLSHIVVRTVRMCMIKIASTMRSGRGENWNALGLYRSALDTRVIVPKRNPRFGVTVNFGHRSGWWALLGLSIVPLGFLLLFILHSISN